MDSINVWLVLINPEKLSGKKGMKLVQKNSDEPIEINMREKYKIELNNDLRKKKSKIVNMYSIFISSLTCTQLYNIASLLFTKNH